jgi:hypothetical protein
MFRAAESKWGNELADKSEFLLAVPVFETPEGVSRVGAIGASFSTTNRIRNEPLTIPTRSWSVCSNSVTSTNFWLSRNQSALQSLTVASGTPASYGPE